MSSKVEICNFALSRLGASRITSFDDQTVEAKTLNAIYDQVAKYVMSKGPWPSVKRRATLAEVSTAPEWGYENQFQLPVDPKCLKVLRVYEDKLGQKEWAIEGDKLLTDESVVKILYLAYITDTEAYDIYLEQAIVSQLIVELAYAKVGQYQVSESVLKFHLQNVEDLLNNCSVQGSAEIIPSDAFIDVRSE